MLKTLSEANLIERAKIPVSHPFTGDSAVLYAMDCPRTIRFASAEDIEKRGLSEECLQAIAMSNAARLDAVKITVVPNGNGLLAAITQGGFVQALERMAGGPVVVAVPTRDWTLAAKADDAAAVHALRNLAGRVFHGEPYSVTASLVHLDGKAWQEVLP
jgi:uncharacterized protein YtpQ (UPF0354 family)